MVASIPQAVVNFRESPSASIRCGTCIHFNTEGSCDLVMGLIASDDVCDLWSDRREAGAVGAPSEDSIIAAGIAVVALNTGRVLMMQRSFMDKTDPARGRWEFPGGKLEDGERPIDAAAREWKEETGHLLPDDGYFTDGWHSPNGVYAGYVFLVPHEDHLAINPDWEDRLVRNPDDPRGGDLEVQAWFEIDGLEEMPQLREEVRDTPWEKLRAAVRATPPHAATEEFAMGATTEFAPAEVSEADRRRYAKNGIALKDGSYPIPDVDHLKRAIQAYGRAPESKRAAVRRHIIKRARALGAPGLIPDDWKKDMTMAAAAPLTLTLDVDKAVRAAFADAVGVQMAVGSLAPVGLPDTVELTDEDFNWHALLLVEGAPTGDGRFIEQGGIIGHRDLPLSLMVMFSNPDGGGGHAGATIAGRIDSIEQIGDEWWGTGIYDRESDAGRNAARLNKLQMLRGISVDLDGPPTVVVDSMGRMSLSNARIMGACYDDTTEILTEHRSWVRFEDLDESDRVATLDKNGNMEFQLPFHYTNDPWSGPMVRFTAGGVQSARRGDSRVAAQHRALDLLVTPNHRMLVESTSTGKRIIMRADELAQKSSRSYRFIATSGWDADDIEEVVIEGQYRNGNDAPLIMNGDDFAAIMGAYLSEGSLQSDALFISQQPNSKGRTLFAELAARLGGGKSDRGFTFHNARLARFVAPLGTARQKFVPDEVKNLSARQLRIFLDHFIAGDGDLEGRRIYTSSKRMAGDLQEIAQKCGMWAVVGERIKSDQEFQGRTIKANGPAYVVALRNRPDSRPAERIYDWKAEIIEHHEGMVRCVSVPNEILYVRRNGIPAWAGNTQCPFAAYAEAHINLVKVEHDPTIVCPCKALKAEMNKLEQGEYAVDGTPIASALTAVEVLPDATGEVQDGHCGCGGDCCGATGMALVASGAPQPDVLVWTPYGPGIPALVASGAPVAPPAAWFDLPADPAIHPVRMASDGRISGYAAVWGECHLGNLRDCTPVPQAGPQGYHRFHTGQVRTAEGTIIQTGPIFMGGDHPDIWMNQKETMAAYGATSAGVGDVRVYENSVGIYCCGAARPEVSDAQVRAFNGSDGASPDWRPIGGQYELVAMLMVNMSAFHVPSMALVASGAPGRMVSAINPQTGEMAAILGAPPIVVADPIETRMAVLESKIAFVDDLRMSLERQMAQQQVDAAFSALPDPVAEANEQALAALDAIRPPETVEA